ncbi:MAG TPA: hypothetical protein VGM64_15115 [Lacunisphaera sp.]|jgi:hypothetical protein
MPIPPVVYAILPHSTADCNQSPEINFTLGRLDLSYDYLNTEPGKKVTLRFARAVAVKFTPDSAITADMVKAYSKVCMIEDSPWITELSDNAKQNSEIIFEQTKHLIIYFDHYGCVEVLASELEILED